MARIWASKRLRTLTLVAATSGVAAAVVATRQRERERAFVPSAGATEREIEPHLALNESGRMAIAWMGVGGGAEAAERIGVRFSSDRGLTWEKEQAITAAGRFVADPVLVAIGDNLRLVWLDFRQNLAARGEPYDMRVRGAIAGRGSMRFGDPTDVAGPERETTYDKPWATETSDGALLVVYRYARPPRAGIAATLSTSDKPFSHTSIVERDGFAGTLATVCASPKSHRAWVVYLDSLEGLVLRASDDGGKSWPAERITVLAKPDGLALEAPACAADGDDLWVLYGLSDRPLDTGASALISTVRIVRSHDAGKTYTRAIDLSEPGSLLMHPTLVCEISGIVDVVYLRGRSDGDREASLRCVRLATFDHAPPPSTTLYAPTKLVAKRSDNGWVGDYFGVAWSQGRLFAALSDNERDEPHVRFAAVAAP